MATFQDLNPNKQLLYALEDLSLHVPTPIQEQAFPIVRSGKDVVGIAQTGTGKTFAYLLPILNDLKFSKQVNPRILILVPTRELVIQVVEEVNKLTAYINARVIGVYGGTNINTQKQLVAQGTDIVVASPGRLYDLAIDRALALKAIQKIVIDEVDVMLDLGFRHQLMNIFDLLPNRRQNIMFSATMTADVDALITDFFNSPEKVSVALSGTPLESIQQQAYHVKNFYTKVNLLNHLLADRDFSKVLVFVSGKKIADRLFDLVTKAYPSETCVIHSNKTQNYRIRSINQFNDGDNRILIATDVMARGLDLDEITHVINFDTPEYPENYMHRIGRTGRAENKGTAILFSTEKELVHRENIENLMQVIVPTLTFPEDVPISELLAPEEQNHIKEHYNPRDRKSVV